MKADRDWIEIIPSRNAVIIEVREHGQLAFSIECKDAAMESTLETLARELMGRYRAALPSPPKGE